MGMGMSIRDVCGRLYGPGVGYRRQLARRADLLLGASKVNCPAFSGWNEALKILERWPVKQIIRYSKEV